MHDWRGFRGNSARSKPRPGQDAIAELAPEIERARLAVTDSEEYGDLVTGKDGIAGARG